ncbi:MAG: NAD(P)H-dependent oxidoreductase [Saprospiraceae bacterium]|nr:NAD(P)H-dependent oxidoreductase [Saprospiraceae bacterium]
MYHIVIISGSARMGRHTPKAALALEERFNAHNKVDKVSVIDVKEYDFPVMAERLSRHPNPPDGLAECGAILESADAIVIASPEYNGSMSGALKNTMDYFYKEYHRKPFGVAMVSGGKRGGINASHDIQKYILTLGGYPMPYKLLIPDIRNTISEDGVLQEEWLHGAFDNFVRELLWLTEAIVTHKKKSRS